jgi:hypothetical protein
MVVEDKPEQYDRPNKCNARFEGKYGVMIATTYIKAGEEILLDYNFDNSI